jgi:hypothetical protein
VYSYEVERIVPQGKRQTVVLLVLKSDTGAIRRDELLTVDDWTPDSLTQADLEAHWMAGTEADVGAFLRARERGYYDWQMGVVRESFRTMLASGDVDQALAIMTQMFATKPAKQQELLAVEQAIAAADPVKVNRLLVRFMYLALGLLAGKR